VECEIDLSTGLPNGKVVAQIRETDPCARPCVVAHEDVHAAEVAVVCTTVRKCLDSAGADNRKRDRCLDAYEANMWKRIVGPQGTECKAYNAEQKCLHHRLDSKECTSKEGQTRLQSGLARVKCYKECYCKE
jgi:hypothetical protein